MQSESKLRRRNLNSNSNDNQVSKDYTNTTNNDVLYNTIKIGLVAATGYGLYKTGVLQPIAKNLLELAHDIAEKGGDEAYNTMHTIKEWSKLKPMSGSKAKPGKLYAPSLPSIFRDRNTTLFYDMYKDLRTSIDSGYINFKNINDLVEGTKQDLNILFQMLKESPIEIASKRNDFFDTDLGHLLINFSSTEKVIKDKYDENKLGFINQMLEDLIAKTKTNSKEAQQELLESGYRKLTLGDILEFVEDKNGNRVLKQKDKAPIDISKGSVIKGSFLEYLTRFFNDPNHLYTKHGSIASFFGTGDWKDIVLDSTIRVDANNNVIDYRMTRDSINSFYNSLIYDFGLPIVKFNPIKSTVDTVKSLFGINHKFGRDEIMFGMLSPNQYDPTITRVGGDIPIGAWLSSLLGSKYADKGILVSNGKAFVPDLIRGSGKGFSLIQVGTGLNLYDITNIYNRRFMNPTLNAVRRMGGLTTGEISRMPLEGYQNYLDTKNIKLNTFQKTKYNIARALDIGFGESNITSSIEDLSLSTTTSIDEVTDRLFQWATEKKMFQVNGFEYETYMDKVQATRIKNIKEMFGEGFGDYKTKNGEQKAYRMYATSKKGYKLSSAFEAFKNGDTELAKDRFKSFALQFVAGRRKDNTMSEYFNDNSTIIYNLFGIPLSEGLKATSSLFGFSSDAYRSSTTLLTNLVLKRALPVYLATKIPDMLNYYTEPFFGKTENGGDDNITKSIFRNVIKPLDINLHGALDYIGATDMFKFLGEMIPGSDQISELPIINKLGLGQTEEERKDYIKNGYEPIRKGRYWGSGNTFFTGGKIMYYRPNMYRNIEADVKFSESKYGSRQEYYDNTWYPNLVNPLAPLNYFIFDRNHYDYKHYMDRPYPLTAPVGQNIPIIGSLFGATIGSIIAPRTIMHEEYWRDGLFKEPQEDKENVMFEEGISNRKTNLFDSYLMNLNIYNDIQQRQIQQSKITNRAIISSSYHAKQMISRTIVDNAGINLQETVVLPQRYANINYVPGININGVTINNKPMHIVQNNTSSSLLTTRYIHNPLSSLLPVNPTLKAPSLMPKDVRQQINDLEQYGYNNLNDMNVNLYKTPSGIFKIVGIPNDLNLVTVNNNLKQYSINKVNDVNHRITINNLNNVTPIMQNKKADDYFLYSLGEEYETLGDIAGLKGFIAQQFVLGHANETKKNVIEDSGYAYSFNNDFWEMNLGGLGGNLSEITRRFIPERNKNTNYINPIRNTMPEYMPGADYFTNFKTGDPYSKIPRGEERLPGDGYERLYGIKNLLDMPISSKYIGYSKEDIVKVLLDNTDEKIKYDAEYINNDIKDRALKAWDNDKLLISKNSEVTDNRHKIYEDITAIVHDYDSPTGIGIVDIKTVPHKEFNAIKLKGRALPQHQAKVNYDMWANNSTNAKGYVFYIDEDKPNRNYTAGFNFDADMLKRNLNTLYQARKDIEYGLRTGKIGRGELYPTLDKFRILADVAPYSQEYKDMSAKLSQEKLTPEQQQEAKQIRERVKKQKEPLRVYPYKFSTSKLKTEAVHVDRIIDNNTILTKEYGSKHAIKFAGIDVSESNSDMYKNTNKTMNEVARSKMSKYIHRGSIIQIGYDDIEQNKFSNDSTKSIKAVIYSKGVNVNQYLLNSGLAKEKDDDSPAGIHARYTKGEIAFGSAMEKLTHNYLSKIPFLGNKFFQVKSPYEMYWDREVYGKDYQSWNNPISGILVPFIDKTLADNSFFGVGSVMVSAFVGSLFGRNRFGKIVGTTIGASIPLIGKATLLVTGNNNRVDRNWRPKRREEQEELNTYVDVLKYVKNRRLYNEYKVKAMKEDNFDVDKFLKKHDQEGINNKLKILELNNYKRIVKLDFKHSNHYRFRYDTPWYVTDKKLTKQEVIKNINKDIAKLSSKRDLFAVPDNALKAIYFKNSMDATMYGYNPGDSLVNLMTALPKKDRQYFKYFIKAPNEERDKILKIAPQYLRRALQASWHMEVDNKPSLDEYFSKHGLPSASWIGWQEDVDMNDVKVKLIHKNKLDYGEFDVWQDNRIKADETNIPVPIMHARNSRGFVQRRLTSILGEIGYDNVQTTYMYKNNSDVNNIDLDIQEDSLLEIEQRIDNMNL